MVLSRLVPAAFLFVEFCEKLGFPCRPLALLCPVRLLVEYLVEQPLPHGRLSIVASGVYRAIFFVTQGSSSNNLRRSDCKSTQFCSSGVRACFRSCGTY